MSHLSTSRGQTLQSFVPKTIWGLSFDHHYNPVYWFHWLLICDAFWRTCMTSVFPSIQVLEKVDVEQKMSIRFLHWRSTTGVRLRRTLTRGRSRSEQPSVAFRSPRLRSLVSRPSPLFVFYIRFFCRIDHTRVVVWIKGNIHVPPVVDPVRPAVLFIYSGQFLVRNQLTYCSMQHSERRLGVVSTLNMDLSYSGPNLLLLMWNVNLKLNTR